MYDASTINQQINDMVKFIKTKSNIVPELGMILGSGLGELTNDITDKITIPYKDIPHLPVSTAPGHAGNLILGTLGGKSCVVMQGRLHIYEGYSPIAATLLVRAMKYLGVSTLFITCAAGALNNTFKAGDIMLINDHINFSGTNPLLGENLTNFGPRFVGMFDVYTPELRVLASNIAVANNIHLCQGIYAAILGPAYATRAELQFLINNHCDAIGMSVVHEAMIAAHSGMKILGLAAITDMALPYASHHATEQEVIESGKRTQVKFKKLLLEIMTNLDE